MSDSDSFIREVSEEVRQDRMFRLWKKYGGLAIGAVVLAVAGTAGWTWMQRQEVAARAELGGEFLDAPAGDVAAQQALLQETEAPASVLAALRLAQAHMENGDRAAAAEAYDRAAAIEGAGTHYGDLARLEAIRLRATEAAPGETIAALEPLTAEGAPYRVLALELRAAAHLNAGEAEAARSDLEAALNDPTATGEAQARMGALLATLGAAESES